MDRYLLLVIWGEEKVQSVAVAEAEHEPGVSSVVCTEKQPGKLRAEKERERFSGRRKKNCDQVLLGGDMYRIVLGSCHSLGNGPRKGEKKKKKKKYYLRGKIGADLWMQDSSAPNFPTH